jgi:uncharacterized membrane protein (DUF4010 family)
MLADAEMLELLQRLGAATGIGFLVGVERGWRHRTAPEGSRAAGLRTHALLGLAGGVAGALLPYVGALGFSALSVGIAAAFIIFKLRESDRDKDISVTGTIAGLMVFAIGAFAVVGDVRVAAAAGVAVTALLAFKYALHERLRKLTWKELRSALLILAATAIALPLLPDQALDPWRLLNPREIWMLTILVAVASFAGYVAVRVLGPGAGLMAGAALGALVSSTIVTLELGRRVRADEAQARSAAGAASLAAAVSVGRVGVFVAATAVPMVAHVAAPLAVAAAAFAGAGYLLYRLGGVHDGAQAAGLSNPLDIAAVARFAALLALATALGRVVADSFGEGGLLAFAATAGLLDVDAVTLAAVGLEHAGVSAATAAKAVLIAVAANTIFKLGLAFFAGGGRYALHYGVGAAAAICAGGAAMALTSG